MSAAIFSSRFIATLACLLISAISLLAGVARAQQTAPAARNITGILKSIDTKTGAFTLTSVGADVDQVLLDIMRADGKAPAAKDPGKAPLAEPRPDRELRITAKTEIRIVFRMSPSIANSLEHSLADLQPMLGHPVSIELGPTPYASKITVWRGTSRIAH